MQQAEVKPCRYVEWGECCSASATHGDFCAAHVRVLKPTKQAQLQTPAQAQAQAQAQSSEPSTKYPKLSSKATHPPADPVPVDRFGQKVLRYRVDGLDAATSRNDLLEWARCSNALSLDKDSQHQNIIMTPFGAVGVVEFGSEADFLKAPQLLEGVSLKGKTPRLTRFSGSLCTHFATGLCSYGSKCRNLHQLGGPEEQRYSEYGSDGASGSASTSASASRSGSASASARGRDGGANSSSSSSSSSNSSSLRSTSFERDRDRDRDRGLGLGFKAASQRWYLTSSSRRSGVPMR